MILGLLTALHVLICILLVLVVLIQSGKAGDLGSVFGGGASQSLFGPTGGKNVLNKVTTVLAVIFMTTSILLATLPATFGTGNALKDEMVRDDKAAPAAAPAAPGPKALATPEKGK